MNRWAIAFIGLMFSFSISSKTESIDLSPGLIFEGTITAENGCPVPGAEIRIVDGFRKTTDHVLSDLKGFYRLPLILASNAEARSLGLEISHLRFQSVRLKDALGGAIIGSPALTDLAPGGLAPVLASIQTVRRDFALTPSRGTRKFPAVGPLDPVYAETYYREALLLLAQKRNREAIEVLKIYAQIGGNLKEIGRSLELIARYDK